MLTVAAERSEEAYDEFSSFNALLGALITGDPPDRIGKLHVAFEGESIRQADIALAVRLTAIVMT
jgi:hypothetical protein